MYEVVLLCNENEDSCPVFTFDFQEDLDLFVKYCLVNYFSVKINYKKTDKDNTNDKLELIYE